jgi:hypothetical protein
VPITRKVLTEMDLLRLKKALLMCRMAPAAPTWWTNSRLAIRPLNS